MEATPELLTLRTNYAAKIDADLELVEKDRERVRTEIDALQDQLHTLEGNHALLLSMREALSGHSPAACPEPGPDRAATTGSGPAAAPVSDGVPRTRTTVPLLVVAGMPAWAKRMTPLDSETPARSKMAVDRLIARREVHLREKTLGRTLYETCARAEEILSVNIEDLDLAGRRCRGVSGQAGP
ncbi:hypothetical protein AMK11_22090 [Streptomyces sp. CB02414]|nr:hypothetical protein AMK11_22090 [Streptomyces sp. CB02414]